MVLYIIVLLTLTQVSIAAPRNLQFSHFVEGYLFGFPRQFAMFVQQTGNILDPYIKVGGFSVSAGLGTNNVNLRVRCEFPLQLINGGCQCPKNGVYFPSRKLCLSSKGEPIAASNPNPSPVNPTQTKKIEQTLCPLQLIRSNLYPETIAQLGQIFREYDGKNNNNINLSWGSTNSPLQRKSNAYEDGIQIPPSYLPNPRYISNTIGSFNSSVITNRLNYSVSLVIFGQFLDHDIDLTEAQHNKSRVPPEDYSIEIPFGDKFFTKPQLSFTRSQYIQNIPGTRSFPNMITGWLDASQIYGSDPATNCMLRQFKNGKLKTSGDNVLPIIQNAHRAGDIRAIQNLALASYHTIFMREHNRVCDELLQKYPDLNDEEIFQSARNFVIGLLQKIVFDDFLPLLLGEAYWNEIGLYRGYNPSVNPTVSLQFSTASFRIGHSLLTDRFKRLNKYNQQIGEHKLKDIFFANNLLYSEKIDQLLRGFSKTPMKEKSPQLIDDIRNLLVTDPNNTHVKLDLFSLNIQRARDHGLGSYNDVRRKYGLPSVQNFEEFLPSDPKGFNLARKLSNIYKSPQNLDLWVGIISEKPGKQGVVGELGAKIIGQTFRNIRDGDRFWYEYSYPQTVINEIKQTTLSQIIRRNSGAIFIPDNIFLLEQHEYR